MLDNANALGIVLVATAALTARELQRTRAPLLGAALGVQAVALLLTASRLAILTALCVLGWYWTTRATRAARALLAPWAVMGLLVLAFRFVHSLPEQRLYLWAAAAERFALQPILGHGPIPRVYELPVAAAPPTTQAHNELLQWATEYGLVGLALAGGTLLLAFRRAHAARPRDGWLAAAALSLLASGLADFSLRVTAVTIMAAALAAIAFLPPWPAPPVALDGDGPGAVPTVTDQEPGRDAAMSRPSAAQAHAAAATPVFGRVSEASDRLAGLLADLLVILGTALGLLLLAVLAARTLRARGRRQLVVGDLANASGLAGLDGRTAGMSQLFRQQLVEQLGLVDDKIAQSLKKADVPGYSRALDPIPLPRSAPDQSVANLASSLQTMAGDRAGPAVKLLSDVLLRPWGTSVNGTLQRRGGAPDRLGLTCEVADLRGADVPASRTIWESPATATPPAEVARRPGAVRLLLARLQPPPDGPSGPSVEERYEALYRPVARWLSLELAERELLRLGRRRVLGTLRPGDLRPGLREVYTERRRRDEGWVRNYIGRLFQASARTFPGSTIAFYDLAIEEYGRSARLLPADAWQPHENLANACALKARATGGAEALPLVRRALQEYDTALPMLAKAGGDGVPGPDLRTRRRLLVVGKATAALLADGIEASTRASARAWIEQVTGDGWDAARETDPRLLFNLASWYALAGADGGPDPGLRRRARRLLAYSLARDGDREYWYAADIDPDLRLVTSPEEVQRLKFELTATARELPGLATLEDGTEFAKRLEDVLARASWTRD
jgi:O-Antigen ligase